MERNEIWVQFKKATEEGCHQRYFSGYNIFYKLVKQIIDDIDSGKLNKPEIARERATVIEINTGTNFLFKNIRCSKKVPEDEIWIAYDNGKIQKFKI